MDNTGAITGSRVIQMPHGGAVRTGGNPGNKGGTGRPPNELRLKNRQVHEKALAKIEKRLDDGEELSDALLTGVLNATGKYGLGEAKVLVPDEIVDAFAEVLADFLDPSQITKAVAQLIEKLKDA